MLQQSFVPYLGSLGGEVFQVMLLLTVTLKRVYFTCGDSCQAMTPSALLVLYVCAGKIILGRSTRGRILNLCWTMSATNLHLMRISGHEHDSIIHLQLNSDLIFLKGKVKEEIINWDPNKFQFGQDCIDLFRSYQRKHWSEQLWQIQPFFSAKSAQSHSCLPHWSGRESEIAQHLCDCHQVRIFNFRSGSCKPQPCMNLE